MITHAKGSTTSLYIHTCDNKWKHTTNGRSQSIIDAFEKEAGSHRVNIGLSEVATAQTLSYVRKISVAS